MLFVHSFRPFLDSPLSVTFSPSKLNQLLVATKNNRLIKVDAKSGAMLSFAENMHRYGNVPSLFYFKSSS